MNTPAPDRESLMAALRQVMDPELGSNIVDLGLVYAVETTGGNVIVTMTLTTRGCPMNDFISAGVGQALLAVEFRVHRRINDVETGNPEYDRRRQNNRH